MVGMDPVSHRAFARAVSFYQSFRSSGYSLILNINLPVLDSQPSISFHEKFLCPENSESLELSTHETVDAQQQH